MCGLSYKNKSVGIAVAVGLAATVAVAAISLFFGYSVIATTSTTATTNHTVTKVQVGGGNLTNPLFGYKPEKVEIKAGETVIWNVPPLVPAEPHTVTFVFDNKTMILGFVASNERVFNPAIIDSNDITKIYPPNASLMISGNEKYVNSGWLFPKDIVPGSSSTFGASFQKAGTYNYLCLLHPWMVGKVIVN
jgi:plastocyanin